MTLRLVCWPTLVFFLLVTSVVHWYPTHVHGAINSYRRSRYDRRVNVFSPEGELLQSSYADVAADRGELVLAAVAKDGSIVVCKQTAKGSKLLVPRPKFRLGGDVKIKRINRLTFATFSGLRGDSLSILSKAQNFAIRLKMTVRSQIGITAIATKMSEIQYSSTLLGGERPFGVNIILMGHESENSAKTEKPKMFCINAKGNIYQCTACATGRGASLALEELETAYNDELEPENVSEMLKKIARKCLDRFSTQSEGTDSDNTGNDEGDMKFDVHILRVDRPGVMEALQ